jgi:predicted metal-dependent enzyme (double-stranded beta helix superfamily)
MRHLLYVEAEGDFVISCIVWLPGQGSAVQSHRVWCTYGIVEGDATEEQFRVEPSSGNLCVTREIPFRAGECAEQDLDGRIIHRVSNRSSVPVISLHLYGVSATHLTTGINRVDPL